MYLIIWIVSRLSLMRSDLISQPITPQRHIAGILGVNRNISEILRPSNTPNGLTVKMNLSVSISKAIDMNCETLLNQAKDSGKLAQIFKDARALQSVPSIENIGITQINSKIRSENAVSIAMTEIAMETEVETEQNINTGVSDGMNGTEMQSLAGGIVTR